MELNALSGEPQPALQREHAAAFMRHRRRVGCRALRPDRGFALGIVLLFVALACTGQILAYLWQQEMRSIREERRSQECRDTAVRPPAAATSAASDTPANHCFGSMSPHEEDARK